MRPITAQLTHQRGDRTISRLAVIGALLLTGGLSEARQPGRRIPVFAAQYWYTGEGALSGEASLPDLAVESHTLRLRGLMGHRFGGSSTAIVALLQYDATWTQARLGADPWQRHTLHAPALNLGLMQGLTQSWGLMGYVMGGIGSDMEGFDADDVRITMGLGATWRHSERLSFVFGAMYTTAMFIPLPLPMLHVRYQRGPLLLSVRIPNKTEIWWRAPPWELGGRFSVLNLRYGLHQEGRFADEFNALNVTAGPVLRRFLYGGIFAELTGGYNARFFRLRQGDATTYQELQLAGYFLNVGVGFMVEVPQP